MIARNLLPASSRLLPLACAIALTTVLPSTGIGQTPEEWFANGRATVEALKKTPIKEGPAKNVILMVGDGMSVTTVTAARILEGQQRGESGEDNLLYFETFPWRALSKTYSVNQQIADSAPTATALVTGVKANDAAISVNQNAVRGKYATVAGNELRTILELAEQNGLSTGVVTTATVTHATPAA
ncbi:MAG: alkaline phosphatase, partial [Chthoniobacteraceae bacterium]